MRNELSAVHVFRLGHFPAAASLTAHILPNWSQGDEDQISGPSVMGIPSLYKVV